MDFTERMDAIERADNERRLERERAELATLIGIAYPTSSDDPSPKGAMLIRADAKAIGAVTAITHRASRSSWDQGTFRDGRVRGVSPAATHPSHPLYGIPSVQVTKNGRTETVTVASLRRAANEPRNATTDNESQSARLARLQRLAGNNSDVD